MALKYHFWNLSLDVGRTSPCFVGHFVKASDRAVSNLSEASCPLKHHRGLFPKEFHIELFFCCSKGGVELCGGRMGRGTTEIYEKKKNVTMN